MPRKKSCGCGTKRKSPLPTMKKGGSKKKSPKDACYRKAKAKYRVFPSAYASGYIAKCRKRRGKIK
tara:strand:+ start:133 stop:330 length:198 start_codon:yes stop_codon:yes gene_type:complete